MNLKLIIVLAAFGLSGGLLEADQPSAIIWGGVPCELSLGSVSERTVQVVVAPLDAQGKPAAIPANAGFLDLPVAEKFRGSQLANQQEIQAGKMHITLTAQPLTIGVHRADGRLVQQLVLDSDSNGNIHFGTAAPVFGLGQGDQQFDRRGALYEMIHGQRAKLRKTHGSSQPVPLLISADGWSMLVRSPGGQFDLRGKDGCFLTDPKTIGHEPLTIYLSLAEAPADAVTEYYHLVGLPAMPPKWTMGYMQSHRTLLGPTDAVNIAQTFRDKKLPIDTVIYLGTGYAPDGWNLKNGSLEFNPRTFPQPAEQIKALHDLNLKVVLHVTRAPKNLFGSSVAGTNNSPDFIGNYWKRHLPHMALGVDGWWPDDGDELPMTACLARHLCYHDGPLQVRPDERPWSMQRNSYPGVTRYGGWIWSGDVNSTWTTLANHVPAGLNASLSMTPFWGTDIGGFFQTPELSGELYTRWFQFAAFNSLFRSHGRSSHLHLPWGWNTGEAGPVEDLSFEIDPAELHNPQVEPICRQYLELRYRLLPYNYTLMREAVDTGMPAMRALWLHYPHDAEAVKLGSEYLWGRDLLVAPVVQKGATTRRVYLPDGIWYDWWTNEKNTGSQWINRAVDLATMPIFVLAGAIIPLDPVRQYTAQPISEPTTLRIYPGAEGSFTLYDDDGKSMGYRSGSDANTQWIQFLWNDQKRELTLESDGRMKKWPGGEKKYSIEIMGDKAQPKAVSFAGEKLTLKF
jgi:alpha-glucosidase (family GH31 glycosyl hydrolase)